MGMCRQLLQNLFTLSHSGMQLAVFLLALHFSSFAQTGFERGPDGSSQQLQPITYEAIALSGEDTSKAIINIHYRIGQHFFIFVRNENETKKVEYIARGELAIELLDEQKVSAARQIRQISVPRPTLLKENERPEDLEGAMAFSVPKGTYQIVFSLDDRESGRSFLERNQKVTVPQLKQFSIGTSHPIFVQQKNTGQPLDGFVPLNRGGHALFGGKGALISQVFFPLPKESLTVQWKLEGQHEGPGQRAQTLTSQEYVAVDGLPKLISQEGTIRYAVEPSSLPWKVIYLSLPIEKLEPGSYDLTIDYASGGVKQQHVHKFRVLWPTRPLSLLNVYLAIDALRHIATEEEINELQSGPVNRRMETFSHFWKQRDPDTTTAYNELMTEYFLRVDEALRKFSTVKEGDGYKTDRGRILILYGSPSKTDRIFKPGGPSTEVWTYEHLKRRFVFIDPNKSGTFILSQTENL